MRRGDLGLREWVGLGAVVGALGLGALFYSAGGDTPSAIPFVPVRGTGATATPDPDEQLGPWALTFLTVDDDGGGAIVAQGDRPRLDISYPSTPFPDLKDDHWRVLAATVFLGPPGEYELVITYKGEVTATIADGAPLTQASPGGVITLPFTQPAEASTRLRLGLRDAAGAAAMTATVEKKAGR